MFLVARAVAPEAYLLSYFRARDRLASGPATASALNRAT